MSKTPTPHDAFFRASFERVEIAQNYLQEYAPPDLVAQLNLEAMQLVSDSFIDEELDKEQSDVLYKAQLANGESVYVYFLFEHKSYPDKMVAFQLLRYQVRIWERQWQNDRQLSPIIPLVIYHGPRPWNVPTDFASLLINNAKQAEWLKPHLPRFEYEIRDFSHFSDEEIRGRLWLRVALATLRAIRDPDLHEQLPQLMELIFALEEEHTGLEYIRLILYYLSKGTEKVSREQLQQVLLQQGSKGEKLMGTIAQEYIREGIEIGMEKGMEQGMERTLRENIAEILAVRLGIPEDRYAFVLERITDKERLRQLLRLASTAVSPAEFEAGLPQD